MMTITHTKPQHLSDLQKVVEATGLFPPELLPELHAQADTEDALWMTCIAQSNAIGFCYATPEELTDGTWNMRAIAVHPDHQGASHGKALVAALEAALRDRAARLLIVDTSGTEDFEATRAFYNAISYRAEARINDFWAPGDDKVIFTKALTHG